MQFKPYLLLALFFSAVVFVVAERKLGRYARNTYDPFKERIGAPCEPGEDSPLNCPAGTSCLRVKRFFTFNSTVLKDNTNLQFFVNLTFNLIGCVQL